MKISILISAYNAEKYIDDCLKSVISQSNLEDVEVIIIDNNSEDKTGIIIDKYSDLYDYIKIIHMKENVGLLLSRYTAINNANGDYLIFLDSDDRLTYDAIKYLKDDILYYNYPDLIMYRYIMFGDIKGESIKLFDTYNPILCNTNEVKKIKYDFCTTGYLNNIWTKAIKREKALKFKNYENYKQVLYAEDRLSTIFFLQTESIVYDPRIFYEYRQIGTSISKNFTLERFNQSIKIMQIMFDKIVLNNCFSKIEIDNIMKITKKANMRLLLQCFSINQLSIGENKVDFIENRKFLMSIEAYHRIKIQWIWELLYKLLSKKMFRSLDLICKINRGIKRWQQK